MKVAQKLKEAHIARQIRFADPPKHPQIGLQQRKEAFRPRDRLTPQLLELTNSARILLGPSGAVATNRKWAISTRAGRRDTALCACHLERFDSSNKTA